MATHSQPSDITWHPPHPPPPTYLVSIPVGRVAAAAVVVASGDPDPCTSNKTGQIASSAGGGTASRFLAHPSLRPKVGVDIGEARKLLLVDAAHHVVRHRRQHGLLFGELGVKVQRVLGAPLQNKGTMLAKSY